MAKTERFGIDRRRLLRWSCTGAAFGLTPSWAATPPDAVATAAEAHHHVVFDNADLRIMRVMIQPGEATAWHTHDHDYVTTVLRGTRVRVETAGQSEAATEEMVTDSVTFAPYEGRSATRRITNMSSWLNHQLDFEILTSKPGAFGPADRGHAPAYTLILDNPRVRAWRLKLLPGAFTPPVTQNGPGVRVVLSGGRVIDTPERGTAGETDAVNGDAAFLAPDTRSVANGGNGPLEMIEFELR